MSDHQVDILLFGGRMTMMMMMILNIHDDDVIVDDMIAVCNDINSRRIFW